MIEREYDISGAIVGFTLQPTPYQKVKDIFDSLGLGMCMPNPKTDQSALVQSMATVDGGKDRRIIPRKKSRKNGVELVVIEKDEVRNGYTTSYGAKVVNGTVKVDSGYANEYKLTEEYLRSKAMLTTTAVGHALTAAIARYDGMKGIIKPGLFYIPEQHLEEWKRLAALIEGAQEGNETGYVRAAMDEGTARAVRDALTKEVHEKAAKLLDDVSKGTLNDTQLQSRAKEAQALVARVTLYSSILNEGLEGLKSVAQLANGAAAAAVMQDFAAAGIGTCV